MRACSGAASTVLAALIRERKARGEYRLSSRPMSRMACLTRPTWSSSSYMTKSLLVAERVGVLAQDAHAEGVEGADRQVFGGEPIKSSRRRFISPARPCW